MFDKELYFDAEDIKPMVTYGTNPGMGMAIDSAIPTLDTIDEAGKETYIKSLDYMGFKPGEKMLGKKIDYVFLGRWNNGRMGELGEVASYVKGKKKAEGIV